MNSISRMPPRDSFTSLARSGRPAARRCASSRILRVQLAQPFEHAVVEVAPVDERRHQRGAAATRCRFRWRRAARRRGSSATRSAPIRGPAPGSTPPASARLTTGGPDLPLGRSARSTRNTKPSLGDVADQRVQPARDAAEVLVRADPARAGSGRRRRRRRPGRCPTTRSARARRACPCRRPRSRCDGRRRRAARRAHRPVRRARHRARGRACVSASSVMMRGHLGQRQRLLDIEHRQPLEHQLHVRRAARRRAAVRASAACGSTPRLAHATARPLRAAPVRRDSGAAPAARSGCARPTRPATRRCPGCLPSTTSEPRCRREALCYIEPRHGGHRRREARRWVPQDARRRAHHRSCSSPRPLLRRTQAALHRRCGACSAGAPRCCWRPGAC